MAVPLLKWPGGKRLLAPRIAQLIPNTYDRYIEPFAGGAAIFFHLEPRRAILADINSELIDVYATVRRHHHKIVDALKRLRISRSVYYAIRAHEPNTKIERAVRFLYLNRTAFNGIYRVNRQGQFNVPFGCKPGTVICDEALIASAARVLRNTSLACSDFEPIINDARTGDVVYADPPYTTFHDNNGFRRYNERLFSWDDQIRLAKSLHAAARRGAFVVVSNANHAAVHDLYAGFATLSVSRASCISGSAAHRRSVAESIFVAEKVREA